MQQTSRCPHLSACRAAQPGAISMPSESLQTSYGPLSVLSPSHRDGKALTEGIRQPSSPHSQVVCHEAWPARPHGKVKGTHSACKHIPWRAPMLWMQNLVKLSIQGVLCAFKMFPADPSPQKVEPIATLTTRPIGVKAGCSSAITTLVHCVQQWCTGCERFLTSPPLLHVHRVQLRQGEFHCHH